MTKEELSKKLNITRQTLNNWEVTKPELLRLIYLGLKADNLVFDFIKLFSYKEDFIFWDLHDFYLDFYFKFLNYFRQNITLKDIKRLSNTDISSTVIIYLIEKQRNELFDTTLKVNDFDLSKFKREDFKKPLFSVEKDLSEYILRNTLDDFETILNDAVTKSPENYIDLLQLAVTYMVYKYQPTLPNEDKHRKSFKILSDELGIDRLRDKDKQYNIEKIHKKFIKFRNTYFKENIDTLANEMKLYTDNDFYIPKFIQDWLKTGEEYTQEEAKEMGAFEEDALSELDARIAMNKEEKF